MQQVNKKLVDCSNEMWKHLGYRMTTAGRQELSRHRNGSAQAALTQCTCTRTCVLVPVTSCQSILKTVMLQLHMYACECLCPCSSTLLLLHALAITV